MMNKKKLLACVCTSALALSLSIPAFAADMTNPTETTFTGSDASSLTVAVSVKKAATKLYVNPYGMSYTPADIEIKAGSALAADDIVIKENPTSAGFFSDTALIENNSTSAFAVKVTMTTTEKGAVKVVTPAPTGTVSAPTLSGQFEIADATAATGTVDDVDGVVIVTPNWSAKKSVNIPAGSGTAGTAGTATPGDPSYTLKAANETTDSMTNATIINPAYAAFRLTGTAHVPSSGSWDTADVADVTVAFTFAPAVATP